MNERIKELMMNSWNTYFNEEMNGTRFPIVQKFDAEKFAELIVKECIDIVLDSSVEYATRPQVASEIKEHFGVE